MRTTAVLSGAALTAAALVALAALPSPGPAAVAQGGLPYQLVVGQVVRDGTQPVNQAGFVTSASADADGGLVTITASVRSRDAGSVVLDIETYDSIGRRVDQQWVDNLSMGPGQEREAAVSFSPPQPYAGPYTVKVGVFEPGPYWGLLLHWNNSATTFELP
jgi:hypothetical protein